MERANLFITTKRFYGSLDDDVKRLPREERMKGYNNINLVMEPMPLKKMNGTPVCIELVDGAVPLQYFEHPEDAIYIFGPEDGGVSKALRVQAHHFVIVPTRNCLNLATTVSIVMYDRLLKETLK